MKSMSIIKYAAAAIIDVIYSQTQSQVMGRIVGKPTSKDRFGDS